MRIASQIFEDELEPYPLEKDIVIEAIKEAQQELVDYYNRILDEIYNELKGTDVEEWYNVDQIKEYKL